MSTRRKDRAARELAAHVSAILKHPDTPECLYNQLADAVTDIAQPLDHDPEEYLSSVLAAHFRNPADPTPAERFEADGIGVTLH